MKKRRSGKKLQAARAPVHEVELALALHDEGLGYKRIAQKLERPWRTVANWVVGRCRAGVGAQR